MTTRVERLYYTDYYGGIKTVEIDLCDGTRFGVAGKWSWGDGLTHGSHGRFECGFDSREAAIDDFLGRHLSIGGPPNLYATREEAAAEYLAAKATSEGVGGLRRAAKAKFFAAH